MLLYLILLYYILFVLYVYYMYIYIYMSVYVYYIKYIYTYIPIPCGICFGIVGPIHRFDLFVCLFTPFYLNLLNPPCPGQVSSLEWSPADRLTMKRSSLFVLKFTREFRSLVLWALLILWHPWPKKDRQIPLELFELARRMAGVAPIHPSFPRLGLGHGGGSNACLGARQFWGQGYGQKSNLLDLGLGIQKS